MIKIEIAKQKDMPALTELLLENGMEYIEPIKDFTLAKEGEIIAGCVRIERHSKVDMIRPIVVMEAYRRKRVGRLLLEECMAKDRPTVIAARGVVVDFYKTLGFEAADWDIIPESQRKECTSCPDLSECNPCPMIHHRQE